jgi:hypothetical protein
LGNVIGNYKGLSHPVPFPNKGESLPNTHIGKRRSFNQGESLQSTEYGSEDEYGHNKGNNPHNPKLRQRAEKIRLHQSKSSTIMIARPWAGEIKLNEGATPLNTIRRPRAERREKEAHSIGEYQPNRTSSDPSDPNLGNEAHASENCIIDPFTGKKVANDVQKDEDRNDDERKKLSQRVLIPVDREIISQLITHHLRLKPGLEAARRQGHEIDRCRGSIRKVSSVPIDGQKHDFFTQ